MQRICKIFNEDLLMITKHQAYCLYKKEYIKVTFTLVYIKNPLPTTAINLFEKLI
jgi:hypothetical protein